MSLLTHTPFWFLAALAIAVGLAIALLAAFVRHYIIGRSSTE